MGQLVAAVSDRAVLGGQDPVHRPGRAQVDAFIQQRRIDLFWGDIDEPVRHQHFQHPLALRL
ncbi:MAG: hypothetical protein ACRDLT_13515 [Solirubrobacteraceae bacterium]